MTSLLAVGCTLLVSLQYILADVYFHVPRGSNNRLKGENANRNNAKRVFDSQNNNKGGYNVGEKYQNKTEHWQNMKYFMSGPGKTAKTILTLEWTNQHGCGDGDLNCNIVLQYKCQPKSVQHRNEAMRNGFSESTPLYRKRRFKNWNIKNIQRSRQAVYGRVMNEAWEWYDKCTTRERNKGLFTADQNLKGSTSKYTRQNAAGTRYGYECPEERDYYPYFHPTDWIDIAVLANEKADCSYYKKESFNTKRKGECMELYNKAAKWEIVKNPWRHASTHNNKGACQDAGGKWVEFNNYLEVINRTREECDKGPGGERLIWGTPYRSENLDKLVGDDPEQWKTCLVALDSPTCYQAPNTRSNHLGNGKGVVPLSYDWEIPHFPSGENHRCVLRIRYNISTNDYDAKNTFASSNQNGNQKSPIVNDPEVSVGKNDKNKVPLQLAINTAQFGRTFQDRSHIFQIIPREDHFKDNTIYNLNVRGKRGNIVQVYPAVEYDFSPKRLSIGSQDLLHIQWAGSNRNPANNDGEGRAQTDRSNIADMENPDKSYPLLGGQSTMFDNAKVVHGLDDNQETSTSADIAIALATAGYYPKADDVPSPFKVPGCKRKQAAQLDCYPPSYHGLLLQFNKGIYYYLCSRNNNFTNRSHKGRLTVG